MLTTRKLIGMALEVLLFELVLIVGIVVSVFGVYVISLKTIHVVQDVDPLWSLVVQGGILITVLGFIAVKQALTALKIILNYVFLCRNRHNDPKWLYDEVFR